MKLTDLIRPNLIAVGVHVEDWEEAVRESGRLLVEDKAVEPRFVDAMIEGVKEFGPYIVLALVLRCHMPRLKQAVLRRVCL